MTYISQEVLIKEQKFIFHPLGAVFWVSKNLLLLADTHFGKTMHFRKNGVAIPQSNILNEYEKLNTLIETFVPDTICFLGDLFHSYINSEWLHFEGWVKKVSQKLILISGNHDIISPLKFEKIGVLYFDSLEIEEFYLTHHPEEKKEFFNICGHVHPAVRLRGMGNQTIKLPCFFIKKNQLILPAFGNFTGNYTLRPSRNNDVYAIADDHVIKVSKNV